MLESAKIAIETMDRLKQSNDAFTKTLLDIVRPVNPADFPNPYDEELFLDGWDDGSGLEPHQR